MIWRDYYVVLQLCEYAHGMAKRAKQYVLDVAVNELPRKHGQNGRRDQSSYNGHQITCVFSSNVLNQLNEHCNNYHVCFSFIYIVCFIYWLIMQYVYMIDMHLKYFLLYGNIWWSCFSLTVKILGHILFIVQFRSYYPASLFQIRIFAVLKQPTYKSV